MDGPTIQAASDQALRRGTTPASILSELRGLDVEHPLIVMTYANIPFRFGYDRFVDECGAAGVHGAILPDVPLEELDPWEAAVRTTPTSTPSCSPAPSAPTSGSRRSAARSRGFVYGVNVLGVTGERSDVGTWTADLAGRLKQVTDLPVVMGFGISSPETAAAASVPSDGVVVASAIMRILLDGGTAVEAGAFVADLRSALDAL